MAVRQVSSGGFPTVIFSVLVAKFDFLTLFTLVQYRLQCLLGRLGALIFLSMILSLTLFQY